LDTELEEGVEGSALGQSSGVFNQDAPDEIPLILILVTGEPLDTELEEVLRVVPSGRAVECSIRMRQTKFH